MSASMTAPLIDIRALEKRYAGRTVLEKISLTLDKGEVAAIIGPSGGGKSSFLRCLTGLERLDGGEVHIAGETLTREPDEARLVRVRRKVGMVFQQFHLFPHLSVLENLVLAPTEVLGESRGSAVARAKTLLDRVGLSKHLEARPSRLSGGEQQRVAIARALMMKPEVLLFDEPTSALDPVMAKEVVGVVAGLREAGQTMMIVTHSMSFARKVATHLYVFDGGQIVESGDPAKIFESPGSVTTKAFLESTDWKPH